MELQRLVVEEPGGVLAVDINPALTVASHENPAVRLDFITGLIDGLGPGPAGTHLELVDDLGRHLAVFRPRGGPHRVIDIDAGIDVTPQFAAVAPSVDVLARSGLDPATASRLLRLDSGQIDRGSGTGTDDDPRARRLAVLDQGPLWAAAEQLAAARARLAALTDGRPGSGVERARAFAAATEAHTASGRAAAAHGRILRSGLGLAGILAAAAVVLVLVDSLLEDDRWTARALLILAAVAVVVTVADFGTVHRARRREHRAVAAAGASSYDELVASLGPLADEGAVSAVLAAAAEVEPLEARFADVSEGVPVEWALANRRAVAALARQRTQAIPYLGMDLATAVGPVADSARVLVDRVMQLRDVGSTHERFPLVLDEPFIGLDATAATALLETVRRLAAGHQIVLVTGDAGTESWAAAAASAAGDVSLVRLGKVTPVPAPPPAPRPEEAAPAPGTAGPAARWAVDA